MKFDENILPIKSKHLEFRQSIFYSDYFLITNNKQKEQIGCIHEGKFSPSNATIWSERDLEDILKAIEYIKGLKK
jgi:hypothetical protein